MLTPAWHSDWTSLPVGQSFETQSRLFCKDAELNCELRLSHRQASDLNCVRVDLKLYQATQNLLGGALDTCSSQGSVSNGPLRSFYIVSCVRE
jgi:hypothetical protein